MLLTRKTREPRVILDQVTVDQVAVDLGLPVIDATAYGFVPRPDQDGNPSLSHAEAAALVERFREQQDDRSARWHAYLADCERWTTGRSATVQTAYQETHAEERQAGHGPGDARSAADDAATAAGERYEREVPRPSWEGEPGHGNTCRLEFLRKAEAVAADAVPRGAAS